MLKFIALDLGPLGLLTIPPSSASSAAVNAIRQWAIDCDSAGIGFIVPEIIDYEIRRELLRAQKYKGIAELDRLLSEYTYLPLTTAAMRMAAELWAHARQQGHPTARDENIDVDVILAAQVLTSGLSNADIVVATENLRHLSQFVKAEIWTKIKA